MLDLERVLKVWPDNTKWNILQIAAQTNAHPPLVVDFLTEGLAKQVEIHDPLSFNEVSRAHAIMMERKNGEIELRRQREQQAINKAVEALNATMEKVRIMGAAKNWRGAYKTLSYFFGVNSQRLPHVEVVQVADECLRLGTKAGINFQEMSQWFTRGLRALTMIPSQETITDALDFFDAYGEVFLDGAPLHGDQYLTTHLLALKPKAMEFDLMPRLNQVASQLGLTSVIDVVI
jgi:hypothetical protein